MLMQATETRRTEYQVSTQQHAVHLWTTRGWCNYSSTPFRAATTGSRVDVIVAAYCRAAPNPCVLLQFWLQTHEQMVLRVVARP